MMGATVNARCRIRYACRAGFCATVLSVRPTKAPSTFVLIACAIQLSFRSGEVRPHLLRSRLERKCDPAQGKIFSVTFFAERTLFCIDEPKERHNVGTDSGGRGD